MKKKTSLIVLLSLDLLLTAAFICDDSFGLFKMIGDGIDKVMEWLTPKQSTTSLTYTGKTSTSPTTPGPDIPDEHTYPIKVYFDGMGGTKISGEEYAYLDGETYTVDNLEYPVYEMEEYEFVRWETTESKQEEDGEQVTIWECYAIWEYAPIGYYTKLDVDEDFSYDLGAYRLTVDSEQDNFNLAEKISYRASFVVGKIYSDSALTNELDAESLELAMGDNIYYFHLDAGENGQKTYRFNIHRTYSYNIDFNISGVLTEIEGLEDYTACEGDTLSWVNEHLVQPGIHYQYTVNLDAVITSDLVVDIETSYIEYTITYEGTLESMNPNPVTYTVIDAIDFEDLVKSGYTFNGWYSDSEHQEAVSGIEVGSIGDRTYYAELNLDTYTITYNLDGGTNFITNPSTYNVNDETIIFDNAFKLGYHFDGWYSDSEYNEPITNIPAGSTGNKVVYAKFTIENYNITYNLDGGETTNPATYTVNDAVVLSAATKLGYHFDGWYTDALFNNEVTGINAGSIGAKTFYAKFTVENYAITYALDGGSTTNPNTYTVNDAIALSNASKLGYHFDGWYTDPLFENEVTNIALGSTGAKTFYAKFTIEVYNISYVLEAGAIHINPATYTVEDTIALGDASLDDYEFFGWYTDSGFTSQVTSIAAGSTGNKTLYAKLIAIDYTGIETDFAESAGVYSKNVTNDTEVYDLTAHIQYRDDHSVMTVYSDSGYTTPVDATNLALAVGDNVYYVKIVGTKADLSEVSETYTFNIHRIAKYNLVVNLTGIINEVHNIVAYEGDTYGDAVNTYCDQLGITYTPDVDLASYITSDGTVNITNAYTIYNITYVLESGAAHTNPATYTVVDTFDLADASLDDYEFFGWYTNSGYTNVKTSIALGSTGDITLYAKLIAIDYTGITTDFDLNVGVYSKNVNNDVEVYDLTDHIEYRDDHSVMTVYSDSGCTTPVDATNLALAVGDNVYYVKIVGTKADLSEVSETYTFNIHRIAKYDLVINLTGVINTSHNVVAYEGENYHDVVDTYLGQPGINYAPDVDLASYIAASGTVNIVTTYIEYTIRFENYDGSLLSEETYHYGDAVVQPATPTKAADNTYTYVFAGWNNTVVNVTGNATYTATYNNVYIEYTITFRDYDGSLLSETNYHYGDAVVAPVVTRDPDYTYTYAFDKWDHPVTNVTDNATYVAEYVATYIEYTVTFRDYDGTVISSGTYHYSQSIAIPLNPERAADNTFTYAFAGWDHPVAACSGDDTYVATYTPTYIEYTIVFKNYDDSVISSTTYHYGDTVVIPDNPTQPSDEIYNYIFANWDNAVINVNADATYKAVYTPVYINYEITYELDGGSTDSPLTYTYADEVTLLPATKKGFTFIGWYADSEFSEEVAGIALNSTGNKTFYAKFEIIEYTITYELDGGVATNVETYTVNDTVVLSDAVKLGYIFDYYEIYVSETEHYTYDGTFDYAANLIIRANYHEALETDFYGKYPQELVTDYDLMMTLNSLEPDENGIYRYEGEEYVKVVAQPFTDELTFSNGDDVIAGANYFFKVKPIEWIILHTDNNHYTIITAKVLDATIFDESSNNYASAAIKNYVNELANTFFNSKELGNILTSSVANTYDLANPDKYNASSTWNYTNTEAKLYLPSFYDVNNYLEDISATVTDYAIARGVYYNPRTYKGFYFYRSPYETDKNMYVAGYDASTGVKNNGALLITNNYGLRVMMVVVSGEEEGD